MIRLLTGLLKPRSRQFLPIAGQGRYLTLFAPRGFQKMAGPNMYLYDNRKSRNLLFRGSFINLPKCSELGCGGPAGFRCPDMACFQRLDCSEGVGFGGVHGPAF